MPVEIIDCEQGEELWLASRLGIPTASMFATVKAKGRSVGESKTRKEYMYKLAGERITGEQMSGFKNGNMDRGHIMEPDARNAYVFMTDTEVQQVGFMRNGDKGASPDSLIADNALLEIKTKFPHLQIAVLMEDRIPPEHVAQVQGQLWVAERDWCDFVSYWPGLPLFIKRVERDEKYIATLAREVAQFNEELAELEEKIRRML